MEKYVMDIRIQEWAKIVAEVNASNQPKMKWLAEHNITKDQFYYWQNKVRKAASETMNIASHEDQSIVEVPVLPKRVSNLNSVSAVIHIGSISIDVNDGASAAFLTNLGRMIKNAL